MSGASLAFRDNLGLEAECRMPAAEAGAELLTTPAPELMIAPNEDAARERAEPARRPSEEVGDGVPEAAALELGPVPAGEWTRGERTDDEVSLLDTDAGALAATTDALAATAARAAAAAAQAALLSNGSDCTGDEAAVPGPPCAVGFVTARNRKVGSAVISVMSAAAGMWLRSGCSSSCSSRS